MDGKSKPTIYCDSMQPAWSARGDEAFAAIDLPRDWLQFVDIVSTRSIFHTLASAIRLVPFRYKELFEETGALKFRIQVSGDGVDPVSDQVILRWAGTWDKFRVE